MPNLFPEGYEEQVVTEADAAVGEKIGYRAGIAFDDQIGDFARDGKRKVMSSTGIESWKAWIVKCFQTQKGAHLAYDDSYGVDITPAMQASSRAEAENLLTRTLTEAALADPYQRTEYIEDITYEWTAPDEVIADITIHGIDDVTIDITVNLKEA